MYIITILCLWGLMYIAMGVWMAWDEIHSGRRMFLTVFWGIVPFLGRKSRQIAEAMEPVPVEGICICKKRDLRDAGKKWCSICGGKIKDTLWKRK